MRLVNVKTYEVEEFLGHSSALPDYAILSHTWGLEEVSLQDMQDLEKAQKREGFKKIEYCCKQAIIDGWNYAWIDTCCIDKSSSAELSEAINSMYKYYAASMVCYAYLSDVLNVADFLALSVSQGVASADMEDPFEISASRWFFRGWTLQELIAPFHVAFYTANWQLIGTKFDFADPIAKVTGIPVGMLRGTTPVSAASVADRMFWASKRQTSREEDVAYCLLGIFDINMPLLYGEGNRAFERLQEAILRATDDHSIFLWDLGPGIDARDITGRRLFLHQDSELCGMLADSPSKFRDLTDLRLRATLFDQVSEAQLTTRDLGLQLSLPICVASESDLSSVPYNRLRNSLGAIYMVALGCQTHEVAPLVAAFRVPTSFDDKTPVTAYPNRRLILFLYRVNSSAHTQAPWVFCRIRYMYDTRVAEDISNWERKTFYIREPIRKKQTELVNDIRQIGRYANEYAIIRRLKSSDRLDSTIGNITAFVLESRDESSLLFVSCGIQVGSAFLHAAEMPIPLDEQDLRWMWSQTERFVEGSGMRPWQPINRRTGPVYERRLSLRNHLTVILLLKFEEGLEGVNTNIIRIYMKLEETGSNS